MGHNMSLKQTFTIIALGCTTLASTTTLASPSKNESWYFYAGLGWAGPSYPASLQESFDALNSQPGVSHFPLSMDLLGFYFPMTSDHRTALGPIVSGVGDRWTIGTEWMQFNQYTYGVSLLHFFGANMGDGFFLRADAGAARNVLMESSTFLEGIAVSDWGVGALLGAGYGWGINDQTRFLMNANYSYRSIQDFNIGTFAISAGFLF